MDVEQGMIEATIEATIEAMIEATLEAMLEAATTTPPIGTVSTDTIMITITMIIMVMTAMDTAGKATTVAAEEAFTSVV